MSSYVPPHLRFTGVSADIRNHEPTSSEALSRQNPASGSGATHTDHDIVHHFWPSADKQPPSKQTLNGSEARPDAVAFINIYLVGHPKWESNGIIFTKTALHLLPEYNEKLAAKREELKQLSGAEAGNDDSNAAGKVGEGDAGAEGRSGSEKADVPVDVAGLEAQMKQHHVGEEGVSPATAAGAAATDHGEESSVGSAKKGARAKGASEEQSTAAVEEAEAHPQQLVLKDISPVDYTPGEHAPFAVFMTRGHTHYGFRFIGWFRFAKIAFLHRHSVELGRLMEQKWGDNAQSGNRLRGGGRRGWGDRGARTGLRNEETWKADLAREWAVLKLEKVDTDAPEPAIEKREVRRNRENEPIPGETETEKQGPRKRQGESKHASAEEGQPAKAEEEPAA